jgi:hypothetical protein
VAVPFPEVNSQAVPLLRVMEPVAGILEETSKMINPNQGTVTDAMANVCAGYDLCLLQSLFSKCLAHGFCCLFFFLSSSFAQMGGRTISFAMRQPKILPRLLLNSGTCPLRKLCSSGEVKLNDQKIMYVTNRHKTAE